MKETMNDVISSSNLQMYMDSMKERGSISSQDDIE
jgi:hypothetical protein